MKLYAIINRKTGEVARKKAYVSAADAKIALRFHYGATTKDYAIGCVEAPLNVAWVIGEDGKWAEVSE